MPFLRGRTHVESRISRGLQIASLSRYVYRDPVLLLYDEQSATILFCPQHTIFVIISTK